MTRSITAIASTTAILCLCATAALAQPPIQGPQDQACRGEAKTLVFTAPNPTGLDPYSRGKAYWEACMARAGAADTTGSIRRTRQTARSE